MEEMILMAKESPRLDLLDRQGYVDQMLKIAETLSDKKKNACYAINGDWGVGKSFVLDMFEEQAKAIGVEGKVLSRYLIFRYNCWEYDYYEEPLVAIVASILDQINENVDLLPSDIKTRIINVLKEVGKGLIKKAVQIVEEKSGVDLEGIVEVAKEGIKSSEREVKEDHKYDQFFDFKKNLKKLQDLIGTLSKEQSVIFIVDELDRCLPEYTIKVLERLHHLFDGIPNVQVILSIDLGQIEHTICQIYGEKIDVNRYLKKIIAFELKLSIGVLNNRFNERFSEYINNFEVIHSMTSVTYIEEFNSMLFDGMDIRSRISVIERCMLFHNILSENSKCDLSFMSLELFLVILKDCNIDLNSAKRQFRINHLFESNNILTDSSKPLLNGLTNLNLYYNNNTACDGIHSIYVQQNNVAFIQCSDIWGTILGVYRYLLGFTGDIWNPQGDNYRSSILNYAERFWKILQIAS